MNADEIQQWLARDRRRNWHPYTQMSVLEQEPPLLIERAEGLRLYDAAGRWYYGHHLKLVVQHPRPWPSPHPPGDRAATGTTGSCPVRRHHASPGHRTVRATGGGCAAGPEPRLLFRQRLDRGRSGIEDVGAILAQRGPAGEARLHQFGSGLPWRHRRLHERQRGRYLRRCVPADALCRPARRHALLLSLPGRTNSRRLRPPVSAIAGAGDSRASRSGRRVDSRTPAPGRWRHDRLPGRVPATGGGTGPAVRGASDSR